ncbi:MAG TPA: N-acetylmuramoyl-L-alanine amidase [Xanthomonadaceae bacterium]|nr:N-acetylmuramoyl-L-alanine amidase [Xanthomonadaceae bacterium]
MLLLALALAPAYANEIKGLSVDTGPTGTRAEILLDASVDYSLLTLAGPDRLVVDLPGVALPASLALPAGQGVVRAVRTGHPVPGKTRVVFDLAAPVAVLEPRLETTAGVHRLVLEWPGAATRDEAALAAAILSGKAAQATPPVTPAVDPAAASAAATSRLIAQLAGVPGKPDAPATTATVQVPTTVATGVPAPVAQPVAPAPPRPAAQPPAPLPQQPMRPLIIAIDAGHGGQDPGAIGKGGSREKDVTLAISRELARQVNATPGLKAYLTRDTDVFIPLYKRARLAREADADIFISIHADAAENRSADGSSVYVLSLKGASSQRARWLADKENAADLIGGVRVATASNTLNAVLLDLTQSGNMKASEDAASQVLAGLQRVGNIHKRDVERANFAVLRTADMPSMLVETAFISNPTEEQRLRDPAFQRKVATAVLDGISTYFERQPPPGTLYALRAAQGGSAVGIGIAAGSH